MSKSDYLNDDGSLRIVTWATKQEPTLADATTPMYGTAAKANPLVSNGKLGLDLVRVAAGKGFQPHTHPGDHLLICVDGVSTITYDGTIYEAHAGEVYLIEGAVAHAVGAITDAAILAVGSPHRPPGGADRMVLTEYDAIAADLGVIRCLVCDKDGTAEDLRSRGCSHAPLTDERRKPVTSDPKPGDVMVMYGDEAAVEQRGGVLYFTLCPGSPLGEMANTLAAAGPIDGGKLWTDRDAELVREAMPRVK